MTTTSHPTINRFVLQAQDREAQNLISRLSLPDKPQNNEHHQPLSAELLSDDVIGETQPRHYPTYNGFYDQQGDGGSSSRTIPTFSGFSPRYRGIDDNPTPPAPLVSNESFQQPRSLSGSKPLPPTSRTNSMTNAALRREYLRLKMNRSKQARYRKRMSDKAVTLGEDVELLRREIQQLELQRQLASTTNAFTKSTPWSVVVEYFRLFGNGFDRSPLVAGPPTVCVASDHQVHRQFLRATMAPDVSVHTGHGTETLLVNWEKISRCYGGFQTQLVRIENGPGNSLVASVKVYVTISEGVLCTAFPHLVVGDKSSLVATLLGRRLEMRGYASFDWDDEQQQVVSAQYRVDMLTPMQQLLGNLEDVSLVFAKARVTPECRLATEHQV